MKKGFTLVELITVLLLLSIVLVITVPHISNMLFTSKEGLYNTLENQIIDASHKYLLLYKYKVENLDDIGVGYILLTDLIDEGILKAPIINPLTGEEFNEGAVIKVEKLLYDRYEFEFYPAGI